MSMYNYNAKRFSGAKIAEVYARFRPTYSAAVYNAILDYCSEGNCTFDLALDAGCGSGQSTLPLSLHFKQVIGIDISEQQIIHARKNTKASSISYFVGAAEDLSAFQNGSVDLISCSHSLHWIDLWKFYPEVRRVLKPGGLFVAFASTAFSYDEWKLDFQEAKDLIFKFYSVTLGPYWAEERKLVEGKYTQMNMPFPNWIRQEEIWQERHLSVDDYCGWLSSWSAYQKYKESFPEETELSNLRNRLSDIYSANKNSAGSAVMTVRWPVFLLMSRKPVC